jgi:hypothetical protein
MIAQGIDTPHIWLNATESRGEAATAENGKACEALPDVALCNSQARAKNAQQSNERPH